MLFALMAVFVLGFYVASSAIAQDSAEVHKFSGLDASADTVYFDLKANEIVESGSAWDVAFKGTAISVNGEARIVEKAFKKVTVAPEDGFKADQPGALAIPTANGDGWYEYDSSSHQVTPVPFRTLLFKLARGGYAKMEIVDYYAGDGTPRSYTFQYVLSDSVEF